jgi:DNA-binding XRE family transcriptional regulator
MKKFQVQEIEIGNERVVIVPLETWTKLLERLEELEDERLFDEAQSDPDRWTIDHAELSRRLGRSPLRYLRGRAGMTQSELAARAKLSQSYIAKVEANKKSLSELSRKKIAKALGVHVVELEY